MPFDAECSTYWCNRCGKIMDVDYSMSNEFGIVLKCAGNEPCDYRKFFTVADEATMRKVLHRGRQSGV